jgi:hypothetical protein
MKQTKYREPLILFMFAVLITTIFSTCSFLYPLNPWDDANVYMTIGNAMLSGKELYVDIFDHKGPVLYLMHEIAAMLSRSSFIGIYLIEIVCSLFFMWYSLRTMRLFSSSKITLPLTCLLGWLTMSSDLFYYGDSVEEFSLPILAHCLYFMLRFAQKRQTPLWWQSVIMGIGLGLIFWTKFNILFFYIGGSIALAYIAWRRSQLKEMGRIILWVSAGVILVSICVLSYFIAHGTVNALIDSYFMVNIFQYHGTATNGEPDFWWFPLIKLAIWAALTLPIFLVRIRWEIRLLVFGTYSILLLSFATMTVQFYYFLLMYLFSPLVIYFFRNHIPAVRTYIVITLIAIASAATNWNVVTMLNGTFPRSILEMAEIINANKSNDSEVLTFSSYDTGIYQHTRHLPPNKNYFMSSILDPDIRKEQAEWVASGKVRYLVREIGAINTCHEYYDVPVPDNYHCIYDKEELFRYRLITTPHKFLWNLTYPRVLLQFVMNPVTVNQRMQIYERE